MRKMNRMSRMMTGLISAAAVLTLITGCGGTAKGYAADADAVKNAGKAKDAYDMAYVVAVEDEWLGLLKDEVVDAAKEKGVNMELFYSGNDTMKLISCVEAAKSKGKDAVLINLNAAEQARACIEAAGDDMKVVFLNREPDDLSLLNDNVAAVGSDEHTSGKFQGEFLAEYFKEKGKKDIFYVLLKGTDGLVHTKLRSEGVIQAMKDAGLNVTEKAVVEAEYDRNTAKSEMDTVLPGLKYDCIIANNDAMAIGAIMAMEDAGIDPASVPVVGIDATEDARELIRQGKMAMSVFQSAKGQAEGSVAAAINMIEGNDLAKDTNCEVSKDNPHVLYVPFVPVTAENVDDI